MARGGGVPGVEDVARGLGGWGVGGLVGRGHEVRRTEDGGGGAGGSRDRCVAGGRGSPSPRVRLLVDCAIPMLGSMHERVEEGERIDKEP